MSVMASTTVSISPLVDGDPQLFQRERSFPHPRASITKVYWQTGSPSMPPAAGRQTRRSAGGTAAPPVPPGADQAGPSAGAGSVAAAGSSTVRSGPVNHLRAEAYHQTATTSSTPPTASGA